MTLRELAERLHCRLDGDGDVDISRVTGIEQAGPGDLTFIANPRYQAFLGTTRASAGLVMPGIAPPAGGPSLLICDRPYLAFAQALGVLVNAASPEPGIDPSSVIAADVQLGPQVSHRRAVRDRCRRTNRLADDSVSRNASSAPERLSATIA